ncbi:hypothetical protein PENDEC_c022G02235 [Penicillium decumbens]|uniref:Uncharacterized protein n=1 Tax=Penicillium decumbens TaxID=69771 RepID=A0A1V6P0W4_PENDC|nr:hypothetical protein PENDEC_c022G02235 [Penicillium decumbens]
MEWTLTFHREKLLRIHGNRSAQAFVVGLKATGKNGIEIAEITGLSRGTCHRVYARALKRGFDPSKRPFELLDTYFGSHSTQIQEEPKDDTLLKKTKYILVVEEKKHVLTFPASTEEKTQNEK